MQSASTLHSTLSWASFTSWCPCGLIFLAGAGEECLFFPLPALVCEITWCFWGCCFNMTHKFCIVCTVVKYTGVNWECEACWGRVGGREKAKSMQPCLCCLLEHFLESVTHRLMHGIGSKSASWSGPKPCYGVLYQQSTVSSASSHSHILFIV